MDDDLAHRDADPEPVGRPAAEAEGQPDVAGTTGHPGPSQPGTEPGASAAEPGGAEPGGAEPGGAEPAVAGGPAGTEPAPPRWSARARVPSPEVAEQPPPGAEWDQFGPPPPRGIAVPVLIVVCVMLLLALAGLGVWLIVRDRAAVGDGRPTVTSPAPVTSAATTPPATTAPATTAPVTTAPAPVAIPDLAGQDEAAAVARLTDLGLVPQVERRPDAEVPAGQVIGTEPAGGGRVAPGSAVTVVVSAGQPSPTGEPSSAGPTESATAGPV